MLLLLHVMRTWIMKTLSTDKIGWLAQYKIVKVNKNQFLLLNRNINWGI